MQLVFAAVVRQQQYIEARVRCRQPTHSRLYQHTAPYQSNDIWTVDLGKIIKTVASRCQGSQEQKVKFQDQISGHFCRFHAAQNTENAHFSVLTNLSQSSRSVL